MSNLEVTRRVLYKNLDSFGSGELLLLIIYSRAHGRKLNCGTVILKLLIDNHYKSSVFSFIEVRAQVAASHLQELLLVSLVTQDASIATQSTTPNASWR